MDDTHVAVIKICYYHSKLVYIGAKGAFRKILESVGQKWIS